MYPEGRSLVLPRHGARCIPSRTGWSRPECIGALKQRSYAEKNFHDLVDMPFFVGKFELRQQRGERQAGPARDLSGRALFGAARDSVWNDIKRMIPGGRRRCSRRRRGTHYNVMMIFDSRLPRRLRRWSIRIRTSGSTPRS